MSTKFVPTKDALDTLRRFVPSGTTVYSMVMRRTEGHDYMRFFVVAGGQIVELTPALLQRTCDVKIDSKSETVKGQSQTQVPLLIAKALGYRRSLPSIRL